MTGGPTSKPSGTPSTDAVPRQSGGLPILVLGGTSEGRELADRLHAAGFRVVSSLAGRLAQPRLPSGEVRVGGFGGAGGLAHWLRERQAAAVVDATHPFADEIAASAQAACDEIGVPLLRLERPPWTEQAGDRWHRVPDLPAAAALAERLAVEGVPRRVFLTIGRQDVGAFAGVRSAWLLIRCVEPPDWHEDALPPEHEILLDRGPFTLDSERALLRQHGIDLVVTRDSGGAPTEAKLAATRELGIPVIVVDRPRRPNIASVESVDAALDWITAQAAAGG